MGPLAASLLVLTILFPAVAVAGDQPAVTGENDRISYSVGYQVGGDFKRQRVELNPELFVKGIRDAMSGGEPLLSREEMDRTLVDLKRKVVTAQREEQKKAGEKNLAEGKKFLEENAKKEGVATLPSGLQYQVIEPGAGDSPKKTDSVTVQYRGTRIDGTEFDSSYKRGRPATFRVDGVIAGWTEALQRMKPGAKWRLFIPSNLAYGERGSGAKIPPNSALIFEVELVSVQPGK